MTEPQISLSAHDENPDEQPILQNHKQIELDDYTLHQSFFTKHDLTTQPNFQVIRFESANENPESLSDGVYMGGTHMNMYHGWGILIHKNTAFEGKFSLGHKMGKGYMKFSNGSVYIGDFTNDKPHGQGMMMYGD